MKTRPTSAGRDFPSSAALAASFNQALLNWTAQCRGVGHRARFILAVSGWIAACLSFSANAGTVTIGANVISPATIVDSVSSFLTTGSNMDGMVVTARFSNRKAHSVTWQTNVAGCTGLCGGVSGTVGNGTWTLTQSGDTGAANSSNPDGTALNPWTLTSTATDIAIDSIILQGIPGRVAFDRDNFQNGQVGTPGSSFGIDYSFFQESGANSPWTVAVTYSGIVQVGGAGAGAACQGAFYTGLSTTTGCGDLWAELTFDFTLGNLFKATAAGNAVWRFFQDTDTIVPIPAPVLTNAVWNGSKFAFDVLSSTGTTVTVVSTTNLGAASTNWPVLLRTNSPGSKFHVNDASVATNKTIFYGARNGL